MEIIRDKSQYSSYLEEHHQNSPIFNKPFWLDAVCGERNWDAILVVKEDKIVAAAPFYKKKKYAFEILTMPKHTQRFSPCIRYSEKVKTYSHRIDFENEVMLALLSAFPRNIYFQYRFHFDYKNVLPLCWTGYRVAYNHTYVIDDISNPDNAFVGFSNNRKRDIKKAEKICTVREDLPVEDFYYYHKKCLARKNSVISYSLSHIKQIYGACRDNECIKIIYAVDFGGSIHAALLVVWDTQAAYHLIPIVNPEFYKSQAMSLLVSYAIKFLSGKTTAYDFEGSMTINIEKAYRDYGALPKGFFGISTSKYKIVKCFM